MNTLSKAISVLSISLIINTGGGVEIIAQARCYTTNYNKAEQLYRQGRYAEARRHYMAASTCPDKPKQNNIATRISACDNAIKRAEQEAEQEAARNGYIRITNIEFGNIDDDGNLISDYGSTLYASDILYLKPRISYEGLCSTSRSETFDVKIYVTRDSIGSPPRAIYSVTKIIYPGNNQTTFSGCGNPKGGFYTPGTYRFEVWHNGNFVYSTSVTLLPKPEEIQAAEDVGYIRVSNIEFGDTDYDGNIISDYGSTLYASDIRYLKPRIYYDGLCNTQQTVTFFYKIYKPNGELESSASSPAGYTSSFQRTVYPGKNQMMIASGWGNNNGGSYAPGTYRYELWHDGNFVYSTNITLFASRLTVDNKTSVSTSFLRKGGQETFYISTDADSWTTWGVPSWCSISSKTNSSFTLICEPNTSSSSRSDYMKVKAGGKEVRIDITQGIAERSAEIGSIWVDHNYWNYGIMGMRIHVKFSTYGMLNRSGRCIADFYYDNADNTPLQDLNNSYCTTSGHVAVGKDFSPSYESSTYNDFTIFIPYSELHVTGKQSLKFFIRIYDKASDEWLCRSDWQHFTYGY